MGQETRICFVCLGNIVRSPLAENLFRKTVEDKGSAESYQVESAGTGDWHVGEPPDPRMRRVAARHGLIYSGLARQFQAADFDRFDWVVAMDLENRDNLRRLARTEAQRAKIRLLREFDPRGGPKSSVPDPYYGGVEGFEEVYRIVERSVRGLLQALENGEME